MSMAINESGYQSFTGSIDDLCCRANRTGAVLSQVGNSVSLDKDVMSGQNLSSINIYNIPVYYG